MSGQTDAYDAQFPNDGLPASGLTLPQAAAYLATTAPDSPTRRSLGRAVGRALVDLADSGADAVLRFVLTPDPGEHDVIWTVRCFEAGGIVPALVRDFPDCAEAVTHLGECEDDGHLFAELIASSPLGLRWTALTRTGRAVSFELPDPTTLKDPNGRHPEALAQAFTRWNERLASWQVGADGSTGRENPTGTDGVTSAATAPPTTATAEAPELSDEARPGPADPGDPATAEKLEALEREMRAMRLESATLHTALHLMAERFATVVIGIESMQGITESMSEAIEGLRAEVRELRGAAVAVDPTAPRALASPRDPAAPELAIPVRELSAAVSLEPTAVAGLQVGAALHEALRSLLAGLHDDINLDVDRLEAHLSAEVAAVEVRLSRRIEHLAAGLRPVEIQADAAPLPTRVPVS